MSKKYKQIEEFKELSDRIGISEDEMVKMIKKTRMYQAILLTSVCALSFIVFATLLVLNSYKHVDTEVIDTIFVFVSGSSLCGSVLGGCNIISWIFCPKLKAYSYAQDFFEE